MCLFHQNPDEFRMGVRVDDADGVAKFLADNPGLRVLKPGARDDKALKRTVEGYADYEPPTGPWWTWEAP
jgi:hypothetical protein